MLGADWHRTLEEVNFCAQIALFITAFVTAWFAFLSVRSEKRKHDHEAFLRMMEMMEDPDFVEHQTRVFNLPEHLHQWTEEDLRSANVVAHVYNKCGLMIKLGLLPRELFLDNFAKRIVRSFAILKVFLTNGSGERKGTRWLADFHTLNAQAVTVDKRQSDTHQVYEHE